MNLNNLKGASFKEIHLMTTARDALGTTSINRFRSLTNNLNFLNQSKQVYSKINLCTNILTVPAYGVCLSQLIRYTVQRVPSG
jgi:hypothetical protein